MNRSQKILIGLLGLQIVLILLVRAPFSGSTGPTKATTLFPDLGETVATRMELEGSDGKTLTVEKKDGDWVVDEAGGYPADAQKVDDLLKKLGDLQVRRPVVRSSRYHKTFKVLDDKNEGRVKVWGEGQDDPAADLILGTSPNYRALNVRRAGDDNVFEVSGLASYDVSADPGAWVAKQLVDVPDDELTGIEVTNAEGTIALDKRDGVWFASQPPSLVGKALDPSKVDALVRQARSIRIDEPAGKLDEAKQGFEKAAASVVLHWQKKAAPEAEAKQGGESGDEAEAATPAPTPEEMTVTVGAKVPDKDTQRYISRSGFGFAGTVWESGVKKLLDQKAADLLPSADDKNKKSS